MKTQKYSEKSFATIFYLFWYLILKLLSFELSKRRKKFHLAGSSVHLQEFQEKCVHLISKQTAQRRICLKKQSKKAVFGHFLKNVDKKIAFFGARSTSKLVYIGAKGAFRKILGSVGQKGISEKVSKGGPFGSAGGRIPEGGRPPPRPPP